MTDTTVLVLAAMHELTRLERIRGLWRALQQLPKSAAKTLAYRRLVQAIRMEADAFTQANRNAGRRET